MKLQHSLFIYMQYFCILFFALALKWDCFKYQVFLATICPLPCLRALTLSSWRWSKSFLNPSQNSRWSQYTGYCNWNSTKLEKTGWDQSASKLYEFSHSRFQDSALPLPCYEVPLQGPQSLRVPTPPPQLHKNTKCRVCWGKCSIAPLCDQWEWRMEWFFSDFVVCNRQKSLIAAKERQWYS